MSLLSRLMGTDDDRRTAAPQDTDARAVERYRYLLRTARPDDVERVHGEAFARLTPQQRRRVFAELSRSAEPGDRPWSDEPAELATSATRSELRRPGFLERTLGGGRGAGFGSAFAGSLLGAVAGLAIASVAADVILPGIGDLASGAFEQVHDLAGAGADTLAEASGGVGDLLGGRGGDLEF